MASLWPLGICLALTLACSGVMGYVSQEHKFHRAPDDSAIFFPSSGSGRFQSARLTGSKRSLPDSDTVLTRYSDLYPQTNFFNAERPERSNPAFSGPQNGFGDNGGWNPPRGNGRPNNNGRPSNVQRRPQNGNQPNWGQGWNQNQPDWNQNQPWGNGGGDFNNPGGANNGGSFEFGRPPPNRPGGGARPPPGRPGNGGGVQTTRKPPVTLGGGNVSPQPVTPPTPAPTRPGCNCPSTPEFNPVCGQDSVTYSNPGKLKCANACGNNVVMKHYGACITTTTPPPGNGR